SLECPAGKIYEQNLGRICHFRENDVLYVLLRPDASLYEPKKNLAAYVKKNNQRGRKDPVGKLPEKGGSSDLPVCTKDAASSGCRKPS
ncbi:MAG: hypothetical protein U0L09_00235, partial [Christensenellales bacterium]|nr:hypothetical protein [Christensenellales bacterium]